MQVGWSCFRNIPCLPSFASFSDNEFAKFAGKVEGLKSGLLLSKVPSVVEKESISTTSFSTPETDYLLLHRKLFGFPDFTSFVKRFCQNTERMITQSAIC